jgi:single-strand DNA-binding protein
MRTYAKATVIGHVGSEVVLRYTKTGKPVVNLSIATNERRKDGPEITTWHRAILWDSLAQIASSHVKKGQPIYLEGPLATTEWIDKDGVKHVRSEITARELILIGRVDAVEENEAPQRPFGQSDDGEEREVVEAEIPF